MPKGSNNYGYGSGYSYTGSGTNSQVCPLSLCLWMIKEAVAHASTMYRVITIAAVPETVVLLGIITPIRTLLDLTVRLER